jgi:hypothetical protein
MDAGESHGWPADGPGASGRGAKANPANEVRHTGPREVESEDVLAWGPGDDRVVARSSWRSDLVLRLATGVAAAVAVALVVLGTANRTPSPPSETGGAGPAAGSRETPGPSGQSRPPSCLVDWPNQHHVPCPLSLPKAAEGEPDCYHPNRAAPRGGPHLASGPHETRIDAESGALAEVVTQDAADFLARAGRGAYQEAEVGPVAVGPPEPQDHHRQAQKMPVSQLAHGHR